MKGGANAEASRNLAVSGTDRTPPHVNAALSSCLALNGSAHSQTLKNKALQPHGVGTSLHNLSDETLQPAPSPIQGIAPRYDVLAPDFRRRAGAYRLQGDVNAAIADFDRAIRVEPKKIDSLLRRGLAYLEMGDSDLAIRDFTEVISLSPRHAVAIRSRAQSYFAAGDLKRAVSDYALLIRLNPRDAQAFYLRGLAERELQEFDRALDDFNADDPDRRRERHGPL